ncbi:DUF1667 domain-containing protein [Pseudoflavonifractor sp. An85]|uniref:DUF1667 domain-containing protein n=1 Tax=Pseudoflavonifractor sp. An85 TaxID=1965661 RepID=UPI000B391B9C|nr:DUF1667 domain-containing protein [Pseudoflavonifractor sp. An85]OUN24915.1 molybdopterin oxidoreductase [Pseudoflavonifractor sp. An85]
MKNLICIVCPKGCHLQVDEDNGYAVTGNSCPRGAEYGKTELLHPTRVLTSTVRVEGGLHRRLPVKTAAPIPKELMFEAMEALNGVTLTAPVTVGQVVISNLLGTGVDVVATRDMK